MLVVDSVFDLWIRLRNLSAEARDGVDWFGVAVLVGSGMGLV